MATSTTEPAGRAAFVRGCEAPIWDRDGATLIPRLDLVGVLRDLLSGAGALPCLPCISLWQPWASLIMLGRKRRETRHWPTAVRGPVLIHAAKTWNGKLAAMCREDPFFRAALTEFYADGLAEGRPLRSLPMGAIVGLVHIRDCVRITGGNLPTDEAERAFGDYSWGRYQWILEGVTPFATPVPCIGRQSFWNVPIHDVREQLAAVAA